MTHRDGQTMHRRTKSTHIADSFAEPVIGNWTVKDAPITPICMGLQLFGVAELELDVQVLGRRAPVSVLEQFGHIVDCVDRTEIDPSEISPGKISLASNY